MQGIPGWDSTCPEANGSPELFSPASTRVWPAAKSGDEAESMSLV